MDGSRVSFEWNGHSHGQSGGGESRNQAEHEDMGIRLTIFSPLWCQRSV